MKKYIIILTGLFFSLFSVASFSTDNFEYNAKNAINLFKKPEARKIAEKIFKDKETSLPQLVDLVNAEMGREVLRMEKYSHLDEITAKATENKLTKEEHKYLSDLLYKFIGSGYKENIDMTDIVTIELRLDL
ncbi:hypothetical protein [Actinobacillus minor]|uniref:Uncharacterized protein n=1 Tax=Actinobacillus minor NM305 TaxID=637911 RepID=C5S2C2_9PAST|nr:hypothetical protein [Actinobacillus minor]EER46890.1 hypothetical protein AM305_10106 [Actinobacillus minor NM305]MDD6909877.1 hypothetical protein [Actinobacillus minor]